jgi:hypothetical protein
MSEFSDLQKEVIEKYQGGEFAHVATDEELDVCGDGLFAYAVREAGDAANDRDEYVSMLRTAISDLEHLISMVEETTPESKAIIPLADRYAHDVLDDPAKVVCLEVCPVRYVTVDGETHIEESLIEPADFHSVYARLREPNGDALAHCIGDFASPESAREYAIHVAKWGNPPWEVHEKSAKGWIPLNDAAKAAEGS